MHTFHYDIEQGTQLWHDSREGKYTGSNAYKVLGPFGANEYALAKQTNFTGNFFTKRGHILEDEAIELFEAIYKCHVSRPGLVTNSDYSECIYSPDGITQLIVDGVEIDASVNGKQVIGEVVSGMLLEVKCFNVKKHMEMIHGKIDLKILAQIHYGMLITGMREARLLIYNPDPEVPAEYALAPIPIEYDQDIADNFKRILKGAEHGAAPRAS